MDSVRNSATGGGSELRGALKQLRRVNRSHHHHHHHVTMMIMMTRSGREEKVADTRATQLTREARFYTSRGAASQARDALVEGIKSQCSVSMFVYPTDPGSSAAQALVPTNLEVAAQLASSLLACGHHDEARTAAEVVLEKVGRGT